MDFDSLDPTAVKTKREAIIAVNRGYHIVNS